MNYVTTIPREITQKGELVVLPRKEYEKLLHLMKSRVRKEGRLDTDLEKSLQELSEGKTIGPFSNARDLMKSIRSSKARK